MFRAPGKIYVGSCFPLGEIVTCNLCHQLFNCCTIPGQQEHLDQIATERNDLLSELDQQKQQATELQKTSVQTKLLAEQAMTAAATLAELTVQKTDLTVQTAELSAENDALKLSAEVLQETHHDELQVSHVDGTLVDLRKVTSVCVLRYFTVQIMTSGNCIMKPHRRPSRGRTMHYLLQQKCSSTHYVLFPQMRR